MRCARGGQKALGKLIRIKLKSITQTCFACPSQWKGETESGKKVFIHYRNGTLTVYIDDEITICENQDFSDNVVLADKINLRLNIPNKTYSYEALSLLEVKKILVDNRLCNLIFPK